MSLRYDAVLLIAFGGPTGAADIRPFLERVLRGVPVLPERVEEVVHHYEVVGGKSPLNEITFRQADALQSVFKKNSVPLRVYVGMRNASPYFAETLRRMADEGIKRALGFILSAHQSEASWERYMNNVATARVELGDEAPEIDYCPGWHDHPLFIRTWTDSIEESLASLAPDRRKTTPLIFTAHSLPAAMAGRSPYVRQVRETATMVANALGHENWSISYQSRSGKPADPWLEPDVNDIVRNLAGKGISEVIVAPIGFVCDHVEVLYDLDIEAKKTAEDLGVRLIRSRCPNDSALFIEMMADVIRTKMTQVEDRI
ncbi:MAG TPA: ferrochelatase [Candidatus Binatia bacterium]|jgi:ferrochelatase